MESLTEQVVEGTFWAGFSNILNRLGALILSVIIARFLLPENFGLYSLAMSLALIFMTFADLGINQTLIRYFSLFSKNKKKSSAYFQYIFKIKVYISLLVSFALLLLAYPISFYIYKKPDLFFPLIASAFFILSSLFVYYFNAYFYAIKKYKYLAVNEFLSQVTKILLIALVFLFLISVFQVLGIITVLILSNVLLILLLLAWIHKFTPYVFVKSTAKIEKIKVLSFLGYLTLASLSGVFLTYIDTVILGLFVSFSYIGYYKVAFSFVFGIVSLFTYFSAVLLPIFTNLEDGRINNAFNKVVRFILLFSIPASFGILALGKYFIKLLYGSSYLPSSYSLYILSFVIIIWIPTTMMSTLLLSKEKSKFVARITISALIIELILVFFSVSLFVRYSESAAIIAAAASSLISRLFLFFYSSFIIKKELQVTINKKMFVKPIIASFVMFLSLYYIHNYFVKDMTILSGIFEVFSGIAVYFIIMLAIRGFSKQDLHILMKIPVNDFYKPLQHSFLKKARRENLKNSDKK